MKIHQVLEILDGGASWVGGSGSPFALACILAMQTASLSAQGFAATDRQPMPAEVASMPAVATEKAALLIRDVKVPSDFDVTIFATPPAVNYPVFTAAAPDGTLYVSSDGNGSLDRKPHLGRVLRIRDTNADGQGDEVRAFVADVDSPRGLVWDHDRLYLLHPPDISVFVDRDGDGIAEDRETLVKGIAFTFKDRPADHSSNGLELGVDGWLYAAIGDFGFLEAVGTDGRKLQLRGGGVVRVRPDGSSLELYANGTRNILEVAVSPLLDLFARDNTNDGGGWDVRLHHFSGYTEHGYPRLFKNFTDETVPPLADYGGGSGCGAAWIDEPGIPERWNNAPFTADWGREWIYHHGLKPQGATFSATQEEFIRLPRVTDLDVDGNSAIYALSWKGASFTWVGPDVGFVVRATPKGYRPEPLPDFATLTPARLVEELRSPSHTRRLAAQRSLVRRGGVEGVQSLLQGLVSQPSTPLASRVAGIFLLKQALGVKSHAFLGSLVVDSTIAPWALRALTDRRDQLQRVPVPALLAALKSSDARARKEAVIAVGRLGELAQANALIPMLADIDPIVRHNAVHALVQLRAIDPCLSVVDDGDVAATLRSGVLRVLQQLHDPRTVDGLLSRLGREGDRERRAGLITALCRLHSQDGPWKGDSWGTRPDTRGPFYQPEDWEQTPKIAATLRAALDHANSQEAAWIGRELSRHRIPAGDALAKLIVRAQTDSTLLPALAAQLAEADSIPSPAVSLLMTTAAQEDTGDAARAQAIIALAKTENPESWKILLPALRRVQQTKTENNLAERAKSAVFNSPKLEQVHGVFEEMAAAMNGEPSLMAEGMLLRLASRKVGSPEARAASSRALDAGWKDTRRRVQILKAAAQVGDASRAAQFVAALDDSDPDVSSSAKETIKRLKIDPDKLRAEAKVPRIADMALPAILDGVVSLTGDRNRGEQLFAQIGCNGCHTVKADEPLKGPFLGTIATIYKRRELAEAILVPNKTLAQGFVANHFELKDGSEVDGFVVQEAATTVVIRTIAAEELSIPVGQIIKREKQDRSLMPEGLANGLTLKELSSLLDYIEGHTKK